MRTDGRMPQSSTDCSISPSPFLPSSFRALSSYLRSVSANAGSIASSVRTAGAAMAAGVSHPDDDRRREQVQWAGFDFLDLGPSHLRRVLLLTYANGFQVWDVHEASNVRELVSRRDGPTPSLHLLPRPILTVPSGSPRHNAGPLLAVVASLALSNSHSTPFSTPFSSENNGGSRGSQGSQGTRCYGGQGQGYGSQSMMQQSYMGGFGNNVGGLHNKPDVSAVRFYSLQHHSYIHTIEFGAPVIALRCSCRLVAVALATQIFCFDAATLDNVFTVLTYPAPQPVPGTTNTLHGAMALGPRWLAYAANKPLLPSTGRVSPQQLTPSPGASPSTSPANGGSAALVAHYAKESSKHLAAGIVTLGDMGYKTMSRYWTDLVLDGTSVPRGGGGSPKGGGSTSRLPPMGPEPEYGGMVIVRDVVSKGVVAQFRAHSSPLSALSFDPSGTLLVTASVCGHNLNVFRLTPNFISNGAGQGTGGDTNAAHVHLYKLYRGLTNAVIQDITFSNDSRWIAVSSTRGTTHLYAISPFGGPVGPETHASSPNDRPLTSSVPPSLSFPWWSPQTPMGVHPSASSSPPPPPPPPITLSVISRIKNGNGGWAGGVTGVAAAATGRANTISGAVAVAFHNGENMEGGGGGGGAGGGGGGGGRGGGGGGGLSSGTCLSVQLWVLSPLGHLIRYLLKPYASGEGERQTANSYNHGGVGVETVPIPELRLEIQPLEKWDVCRRPGWVERDESLQSVSAPSKWASGSQDDSGAGIKGGEGEGRDGVSAEEMQRWFMSNAEVMKTYHGRSVPIWARNQVHFHVLLHGPNGSLTNSGENDKSDNNGRGVFSSNLSTLPGGPYDPDVNIEEIPTRPIEVRRRDLVPLCERLEGGHNSRERSVISQTGISERDSLSRIHSGSLTGGLNDTFSGFSEKKWLPNGSNLNGFHVDHIVMDGNQETGSFSGVNGHFNAQMGFRKEVSDQKISWAVPSASNHQTGFVGIGTSGMNGKFANGYGIEKCASNSYQTQKNSTDLVVLGGPGRGGHLSPMGDSEMVGGALTNDEDISGQSTPSSSCESVPSPPLRGSRHTSLPSPPLNSLLQTSEPVTTSLVYNSSSGDSSLNSNMNLSNPFRNGSTMEMPKLFPSDQKSFSSDQKVFSSDQGWSLRTNISRMNGTVPSTPQSTIEGSQNIETPFEMSLSGRDEMGRGNFIDGRLFPVENCQGEKGLSIGLIGEFCDDSQEGESSFARSRGSVSGRTTCSREIEHPREREQMGSGHWVSEQNGGREKVKESGIGMRLNVTQGKGDGNGNGNGSASYGVIAEERESRVRHEIMEKGGPTLVGIGVGEDDIFVQQEQEKENGNSPDSGGENSMDGWDGVFGLPDEDC